MVARDIIWTSDGIFPLSHIVYIRYFRYASLYSHATQDRLRIQNSGILAVVYLFLLFNFRANISSLAYD